MKPTLLRRFNQKVKPKIAKKLKKEPVKSKFSFDSFILDSTKELLDKIRAIIAIPRGTLIKNIQCQESKPVKSPLIGEPSIIPKAAADAL